MKNAIKTTTAIFGTITGLAGIEHGVGEILQGSKAPESWAIQSWPDAAVMKVVSGEPAMTILPNLLVTGILAILFSLIFIAWATFYVQRRKGGLVLMLICIPMLLFGAGFAPPLLGLILGATATRIPAVQNERRALLTAGLQGWLARLWPWFLGACLAAWLAMMPGTMLLDYFWGFENPDLTYGLMAAMFGLLFLTILAGNAKDSQRTAAAG